MKEQLRKLRLLGNVFNLNMFYDIDLEYSEIKLQGKFNTEIVKICVRLKFRESFHPDGYLKFRRNNIEIILT